MLCTFHTWLHIRVSFGAPLQAQDMTTALEFCNYGPEGNAVVYLWFCHILRFSQLEGRILHSCQMAPRYRGDSPAKAFREECHYVFAEQLGLGQVVAPCVAMELTLSRKKNMRSSRRFLGAGVVLNGELPGMGEPKVR